MTREALPRDLLRQVDPTDIDRYARLSGWLRLSGFDERRLTVYEHPNLELRQLLVPTRQVDDYERAMADMVEKLAEVEQRSSQDILNDLLAPHALTFIDKTTQQERIPPLLLQNLWLVHPEEAMCAAFRQRFAGLTNVRVVRARFEELPPHDCFVTAGNAFGLMTAGIDAAVVRFFGEALMKRVQYRILNEFLGEQPIGTAFIEPTGHPDRPFVAHAPTMRVPGSIDGTDRVYSATWAALLAVYSHNVAAERKIETLAFPAMGTGFGGVPFDEAARQMAAAYAHYLSPPHRLDWDLVVARHKAIAYDGTRQVVSRG
jgi:O-acetyl-ADP-ribose deacetylase (regulator of RNase III)